MKSAKNNSAKTKKHDTILWGASVSTHQVEGGNHNQWSIWELENAQYQANSAQARYSMLAKWPHIKHLASKPENYVSGVAANHFKNYSHDFDIASKLHLSALRSGIEWSRIEPEEGEFNYEALAHYRAYFTDLKARGITPIVTLWHWTFPEWFAKKGGFSKRRNIRYFTRYVQFVMEELNCELDYIITINEPTVYTTMSYLEKRWPPQHASPFESFRVLMNLAAAHNLSYRIIKKYMPSSRVGLAHNCSYFYTQEQTFIPRLLVKLSHKFGNEFFINRVKGRQDFLGVNYYFANKFVGRRVDNTQSKTSDLGWPMQPDKLGPLLVQLSYKYNLPIIVTESGVADADDVHRKWWILENIKSIDLAKKNGAVVLGYIHWSLLDNFEWAEGFWPRFGLVAVDFKTQKRTIRNSARWYANVIQKLSESKDE